MNASINIYLNIICFINTPFPSIHIKIIVIKDKKSLFTQLSQNFLLLKLRAIS